MKDINWRTWSDEAFDDAASTGKPVLLSISAVWCHWCHVMDETTYTDPRVVQLINEQFVPIRVDNDRNPDINARYNMGGWPTTAILTHNRNVLTGATYLPADQLLYILHQVLAAYSEQREEVIERAKEIGEEVRERSRQIRTGAFSSAHIESILQSVRNAYDSEYGGFGRDQKFPFTNALNLLLLNYEQTGNERDLDMVVATLNAMIDGDIFDTVEGGMFRYATKRDWTMPHFEKMLGDNAAMAAVLLDAYRLADQQSFLDTARHIFRYVETVLTDPDTGLAYGSQDADEKYYSLDLEGRRHLTPPKVDTAAYTDSNSSLALAYLRLWTTTGDAKAKAKALRIIDFLNSLPTASDGTVCHYYEDGKAHEYGNLIDCISLMQSNIACSEAAGRNAYISRAQEIVRAMLSSFRAENGGLYDISAERAKDRGLDRYVIPLPENSQAALAIAKLGDLTADALARRTAGEILNAVSGQYADYGVMASDYAVAASLLITEPVVVTVIGVPEDPQTTDLIKTAMGVCGGLCTVRTHAPEEHEKLGATVCVGSACMAQVTDPDELEKELEELVTFSRD